MKVVFLEDVEGVAQGGEVKDVKNGFAQIRMVHCTHWEAVCQIPSGEQLSGFAL